jgi:hypothetical protein
MVHLLAADYILNGGNMDIIGFCLGTLGFILGSVALAKVTKLENYLKEKGILDKTFKSD